MDAVAQSGVPLRVGKKMRKRRELDALVGGGGRGRGGRLLSASSDEAEVWGRSPVARRKRYGPVPRVFAIFAALLALTCAGFAVWVFFDVRKQFVAMRMEMDKVSTCSESVSGSLQELHAASKALETGGAQLGARLDELEAAHGALLKNVTQALRALDALRRQLDAAPQLTEVPDKLDILQKSIGELGSRIGSLEKTSENTKTAATAASKDLESIMARLAVLDHRLNTSLAEDVIRAQKVDSLEANLTARVDQLRIELERTKVPASTLVPTPAKTSTSATTTTTPTTTTTTPTTTTSVASANLTVPAQVPSKPLKTGAM